MKILGGKTSLTLPVPSILQQLIETKKDINFYFHTSFWYLKKVSSFLGTKKKCKNKEIISLFPLIPN